MVGRSKRYLDLMPESLCKSATQGEPPCIVAEWLSVSLPAGMNLAVFQVVLCIVSTFDSP